LAAPALAAPASSASYATGAIGAAVMGSAASSGASGVASATSPARRMASATSRADTPIPTPARPVAPDAQPDQDAEPILELPPRRRAPAHAASATPTSASSLAPVAALAAPLAATAYASPASPTGAKGEPMARAGATAPLMNGAPHDAASGSATRQASSMRAAPHQGDAAARNNVGRDNDNTRRNEARGDAQGDERPQPRRTPVRAPGGMLPLGDAARAYAEAIAPRRRAQRDEVADAASAEADAPPAAGMRSASRAKRSVRAEESLVADVCPICRGVGYVRADAPVGDPAFGQALPCVCKERQLEERRRSDLWRISSLAPFEKKTFETFEGAVTPGVREAYEAARRYADDPQGWLILSGGYGVGKTHLAAAIANEQLSRGAHVFFSIVPDLLDHLRAAFAPSSESPFDEMFDRVREAGLLVLDDLGAENGTAWATEKLFQLINYRYNFRMPTVITTNHRLLSHMDERIRSRLSDLSLARHVAIEAPDYRERHSGRGMRAPTPGPSPRGRGGVGGRS